MTGDRLVYEGSVMPLRSAKALISVDGTQREIAFGEQHKSHPWIGMAFFTSLFSDTSAKKN